GGPEIPHRQSVLAIDQIVAVEDQLMLGVVGGIGKLNRPVLTGWIRWNVILPVGELQIHHRQGNGGNVGSIAGHLNTGNEPEQERIVGWVSRMIGRTHRRSQVSRRAIGRQREQKDTARTARRNSVLLASFLIVGEKEN